MCLSRTQAHSSSSQILTSFDICESDELWQLMSVGGLAKCGTWREAVFRCSEGGHSWERAAWGCSGGNPSWWSKTLFSWLIPCRVQVADQTSPPGIPSFSLSSTSPCFPQWHSPPLSFSCLFIWLFIYHLSPLKKMTRAIKRGTSCVLFTALSSALSTVPGIVGTW